MGAPVLILGAGASIDAGLPNAYDLTQLIYERLRIVRPTDASLFAYVIGKLITRQARAGDSPFNKLNVEEVYDALKRFLGRDRDVLSEFVYSWDTVAHPSVSSLDRHEFAQHFSKTLEMRNSSRGQLLQFNTREIDKVADAIDRALNPVSVVRDHENTLSPYLQILTECLTPNKSTHKYLSDLSKYIMEENVTAATLNYDRLLEENLTSVGGSFDYGLSYWNKQRYIKFRGLSSKIIKLHGSVDWYEDDDNIEVSDKSHGSKRAMIFGGQSDKLVPHGPYLQLRHEFQRFARASNKLGIIGYSFQDAHLNALIRAWMSTRQKAKLVILDPAELRLGEDILGSWFTFQSGKDIRYRVEIDHIREFASAGMAKFITSLKTAPNPEKMKRS